MTSPLSQEPDVERRTWRWPLPLETYDLTSTLTLEEEDRLRRLDGLVKRRHSHHQRQLRHALQRLIRPIEDALAVAGVGMDHRPPVVNPLLQVMLQRRTALWGWTVTEWEQTLTEHLLPRHRHPASTVAYLLGGVRDLRVLTLKVPTFTTRVFGTQLVETAVARVVTPLHQWGYRGQTRTLYGGICRILLANGSPYLEDLTFERLVNIQARDMSPHDAWVVGAISRALVSLGCLSTPLPSRPSYDVQKVRQTLQDGIAPEWVAMCQRWYATSTLEPRTRRGLSKKLLRIGRWLAQTHPAIVHPKAWTRDLAAEFVAAVTRLQSGDWTHAEQTVTHRGSPMAAESKNAFLHAARRFFGDCQEWGWIPIQFNPKQCFRTPRSILAAIGPNPRIIADDIWAKLLSAGLNLTESDLPRTLPSDVCARYPLAMVRAMAIVWLFAGLRSDELRRLRVGCVRWLHDEALRNSDQPMSQEAVCLLDVPVNKTSTAFTKPVDYCVGEAIREWEKVRPVQPLAVDRKTGEVVAFLFSHRGRQVGHQYVNHSLIPILCRKAGVPDQDARGNITSHRARSTIATQLYNAKEPMSLVELQTWLGHKHPNSTQHYAKLLPTKLARSYVDAGYFGRNVRTIEVLIDQAAVMNGDAAQGLPWKYYDLGHGYCTYDFFEQCEHRMACAQCAFYRLKAEFGGLLLEKKRHLLHMKQEIPLTELELATVEGDLAATEKLLEQLVDVPTPAGPTPRQLNQRDEATTPTMS